MKSNKNIIQQVITGHKPDDNGILQIRDILVYDVPTISLQMKQQKKYQTVHLKIELTSFHLAQFKGNDGPVWTTDLGDTGSVVSSKVDTQRKKTM
ncbi:hypothetical protein RhiirA1_430251 [Rhizophagus irregularis]|uniref:Uncharacterized protein n=1 Tax=Rhizophagus irregularis TaxID=588596 RepID=A0A2I1FNF5_9GLOM|nr:hypothetical protein RhiirA1_430251 [Rhizophagus irregularis]PKY35916.1 hypothetical protein RhiirB3_421140 [Rhizophagus irregularis]